MSQWYEGRCNEYRTAWEQWRRDRDGFLREQEDRNRWVDDARQGYLNGDCPAVVEYFRMVLANSEYPEGFPTEHECDYCAESKTLVIEYSLPALDCIPAVKAVKYVQSRDELVESYLTDKVRQQVYDDVIYAIALRTLHELYTADTSGALESVVLNGFVRGLDVSTGQCLTTCIISVQAGRSEFLQFDLEHVEPKACFRRLRGLGSAALHSLVPVAPIQQISREDPRFVAAQAVVDGLDGSVNLAAIAWEDFEHLVRELFERELSASGGEVRVTRTSRDGGVDAIAFDPDPIRGGKIVIQAKRYTNVVGVSAVRDLYGTVMNEGATKGILVTTSHYGGDAYEFAKGKPLTLLDGGNLLHLLQKHGRNARIDLEEAKGLKV